MQQDWPPQEELSGSGESTAGWTQCRETSTLAVIVAGCCNSVDVRQCGELWYINYRYFESELICLFILYFCCCWWWYCVIISVNTFPVEFVDFWIKWISCSSAAAVVITVTTEMGQALCFGSIAALHGQITAHAYYFLSACTAILHQQGNYAQCLVVTINRVV